MREENAELSGAAGVRIGLDVGGTKTEAVALGADGRVLTRRRISTRLGNDGVLGTAEEAVALLAGQLGGPRGASLGVGIPGAVDPRTGRVTHAVNLGIADLDLAGELAARLGMPARVENDATAAAWGAFRVVADERPEPDSLALLNLGTGLAAGLVLAGRPWRGASGGSGEVGHLAIDPHGEQCPCGQRGCLETVASGSGIARRRGGPASELVAAALEGDPDARATWDDLVAGVDAAVRVLVQTLDVELVLLGGGVAAAEGSALLAEVRQRLARSAASSPYLAALELPGRVDLLRTDAPVAAIGAALLGSGEEVPWPR